MGWIMGNQSGPQDLRMSGKGMQEGRMKGKREGERAVRDNGVAAFISLWIYIWEGGAVREERTERCI